MNDSETRLTAVLGPTNTGKTHLAMERLIGHRSGMIGFPLRLLARENYDRLVKVKGPAQVALGEEFAMPDLPQLEGIAWPLVTGRPPHLLPPRFTDWHALFEDAAREVRDSLKARGPLEQRTWGERNTARICHPLAEAVPQT